MSIDIKTKEQAIEFFKEPYINGTTLASIFYFKPMYVKPEFLFCQSAIETAWFTSYGFRVRKNLFGMSPPKKRVTTMISESKDQDIGGTGFKAIFPSYTASILDYYMRMENFGIQRIDTLSEFTTYILESKYAVDKQYIKKITEILNNLPKQNIF